MSESPLRADIAAFDKMRKALERDHRGEWVVFHKGAFVDTYPDFQAAAADAIERFDAGPYLIRQVGVRSIPLAGGMVFTPAHVLGPGGI